MEDGAMPKQKLRKRFMCPTKNIAPTLFPFKNLEEFYLKLEISSDELKRWFKRGWISFDPERDCN